MSKKYYDSNDPIFVDGINKIIHLSDRETELCIEHPPLQTGVFNSYVSLIKYQLGTNLILCPYCFEGVTSENFQKVPELDFNKCIAISSRNENSRLKFLNK